ncbi:hypothetical protein ACE1CI_23140 [Aerosakkonemataceae cyanobacterium BLCC-F50]|uniref:Uncharacterized protein n=1 Tax=Floridaenema flaviceps BLCC-F50 TaxID=3153642 RepID=A0ABV4XVQ4_9CYAN
MREGYWYDKQNHEQHYLTPNLSIANLRLLKELSEREPTAKVIETLYIFCCLYIQNDKWQRFEQNIGQYELAILDKLIKSCVDRFGSSVRKFELGIQYYYEVDCGSAPGNSAWLHYTKNLMLNRCLEIWPCIKLDQIKRGLALQKSGEASVKGHIGSLNAKKAINKQEYAAQESWIVVNREALKRRRCELLPESGIEAARRRAHQWQSKRTETAV